MAAMHTLEQALVGDWSTERWSDVTVLVAVSGGADSVALLRAMHRLKTVGEGRLLVAHFNHRWRGAESDADAVFVRQLSKQLGMKAVLGRARLPGGQLSAVNRSEDSARNVRYRFLAAMADRYGARYVVTAHTANDQAETVLQRVLRGTGLAGLAGIPRVRRLTAAASLIRPLLKVRRSEVVDYLQFLDQPFREDSSNSDRTFVRNRIRHELLPQARACYADADDALLRLASLAGEAQSVLDQQAKQLAQRAIVERQIDRLLLVASAFDAVPPFLLREVLRHLWRLQDWPVQHMGHAQWTQLAALLAAQPEDMRPASQTFPGNVRAEKQGGLLTLTRPALLRRNEPVA